MTPRTKTRLADQHLTTLREQRRQLDDLFSLRQAMYRQISGLDSASGDNSRRRESLEASVSQINDQITAVEKAASETSRTLKVIGVDVIEDPATAYA